MPCISVHIRITHPYAFLYIFRWKKELDEEGDEKKSWTRTKGKQLLQQTQNEAEEKEEKKEILWWRPSIFFSTFWMTGQSRNVPKIFLRNIHEDMFK